MPGFSPAQLSRDLDKIVRFFGRNRVPYFLIGGLALSLWGRPRTTLDLDFLVRVDEKGLEKLKSKARKERFRLDKKWLLWNPLLRKHQIRLRLGSVAVDLLAPRDDYDRGAFRRRRRRKLGRKYYFVVAPEDLILQKLKVGRPRDFEDVVTIVERMGRGLDMNYLRTWARKLGVFGELNYVLNL